MTKEDVLDSEFLIKNYLISESDAQRYIFDLMAAIDVFDTTDDSLKSLQPDKKLKTIEITADYINKLANARIKKILGYHPLGIDNIVDVDNVSLGYKHDGSLPGFNPLGDVTQKLFDFDYATLFNHVGKISELGELSKKVPELVDSDSLYFDDVCDKMTFYQDCFSMEDLSNPVFLEKIGLFELVEKIAAIGGIKTDSENSDDYELSALSKYHSDLVSNQPSKSKLNLVLNPAHLVNRIENGSVSKDINTQKALVDKFMAYNGLNSLDDALLYRSMQSERTSSNGFKTKDDIIMDSMLEVRYNSSK